MPYQIKANQRKRAAAIGVTIKPSNNKGKKLDVFKNDKKVASIGALGMSDFETYRKTMVMNLQIKDVKLIKLDTVRMLQRSVHQPITHRKYSGELSMIVIIFLPLFCELN